MINIEDLTPADIGRKVVYEDLPYGIRGEPHGKPFVRDEGTLTSWNDQYVFVRFRGPGGEACRPSDVSFICDMKDRPE